MRVDAVSLRLAHANHRRASPIDQPIDVGLRATKMLSDFSDAQQMGISLIVGKRSLSMRP